MKRKWEAWRHQEMHMLHGLVANGRTSADIARIMNRSASSVRSARRHGLPKWRAIHIEGEQE